MKICSSNIKNLKQALALSKKVFKSAFMKDNYTKEPGFKLKNFRMLYQDNSLASIACVLPRIMNFDGLKLKMAGIAGVATSPRFRNRGFAADLMRDTAGFMEKENYALSLLYPYKTAFYSQFGYRQIIFPVLVIDRLSKNSVKRTYDIKEMVKPAYRDLSSVYNSFNTAITGSIERPLKYWKITCEYWAGQEKILCWEKTPYIAAYQSGRLCAYVKISEIRKNRDRKKFSLKIAEFACLPGAHDALPELTNRAFLYAKKRGLKKIFIESSCSQYIKSARKPSKPEMREYHNLMSLKMYKICNFSILMKTLGRAFTKRLKKSGIRAPWKELISIERKIRNFHPEVKILLKKNGKSYTMDEKGFIEILFGLKHAGKERLLNLLFPQLKPVYWDFDYL